MPRVAPTPTVNTAALEATRARNKLLTDAELTGKVKAWVAKGLQASKGSSTEVRDAVRGILKRCLPEKKAYIDEDWDTKPVPEEITNLITRERRTIEAAKEAEQRDIEASRRETRRKRRRSSSDSSSDDGRRKRRKDVRRDSREYRREERDFRDERGYREDVRDVRDVRDIRDVRDVRDTRRRDDSYDREDMRRRRRSYESPSRSPVRAAPHRTPPKPAVRQEHVEHEEEDYIPVISDHADRTHQPAPRVAPIPRAPAAFSMPDWVDIARQQQTFVQSTPHQSQVFRPLPETTALPLDSVPKKPKKQFTMDDGRKGERQNRFEKKSWQLPPMIPAPSYVSDEREVFEEDDCEAIVGVCQDLEKAFTRSAAGLEHDPRLVRPQHILQKSLKYIIQQQRKKSDPKVYCYEQFKSIRQDLTVQHIFNTFTTEVYETHARVCLQHGDVGEFNACQSKLRVFHKNRDMIFSERNVIQFTALRIMYCCLTKSHGDLAHEVEEVPKKYRQHPQIRHAMSIIPALTPLNIFLFDQVYNTASEMAKMLIDLFLAPPRGLRVQVCTFFLSYFPR